MSVLQGRGGFPHIFRESIPTTGRLHQLPFNTSYLFVRNEGANVGRLYFTEEDFDADENYALIPVSTAATPYGEWGGPVELGALPRVWLRGVGGNAALALYAFQRRA